MHTKEFKKIKYKQGKRSIYFEECKKNIFLKDKGKYYSK